MEVTLNHFLACTLSLRASVAPSSDATTSYFSSEWCRITNLHRLMCNVSLQAVDGADAAGAQQASCQRGGGELAGGPARPRSGRQPRQAGELAAQQAAADGEEVPGAGPRARRRAAAGEGLDELADEQAEAAAAARHGGGQGGGGQAESAPPPAAAGKDNTLILVDFSVVATYSVFRFTACMQGSKFCSPSMQTLTLWKTWLELLKTWLELLKTWLELLKTWLELVKTWLELRKTWRELLKTWRKSTWKPLGTVGTT
ncbi:hypothetical protein AVEN_249044-1 [Araneus ventricosus]|uniref:Uncharacterized protein n=1 Tax=Araneus ventricosus TaxID=182803 RepID=A0A4Y2TUV5_ARAVE|nr:hypothetical protein AVEN_249044-1 [Araneus ventricosus]